MAIEDRPKEDAIPFTSKSGDWIQEGKNGQLLRLSYSNFTNKGFIDLTLYRDGNNKDIQPAKVRLYMSGEDNTDKLFGLSGKGTTKESKPTLYIEAESIRIINTKNKNNVQNAVLGNELLNVLSSLIDTLIEHKHPMESPSVDTISKWKKIKQNLNKILSKGISIS